MAENNIVVVVGRSSLVSSLFHYSNMTSSLKVVFGQSCPKKFEHECLNNHNLLLRV